MPVITFPDQQTKTFSDAVTPFEIAQSISNSLAKRSIAAVVNGELIDMTRPVAADASIEFLGADDERSLEVIRHSTAHLMAQAVQRLYPEAQVTIGPVIEDGFYYDFAFERAFTPEDLTAIEKQMQALVKENLEVVRQEVSRDDAIALFKEKGEHYKVSIIESIDSNEILSLYQQGEFVDLCRGPHVARTGQLKAFKLTKLAGAYWRGDSNNAMLQRIYGTAWGDKTALKDYLYRIEEAQKRDHRALAKKMNLFHLEDGMVFWHPNGWTVNRQMRDYLRVLLQEQGYQEVNTPALANEQLWVMSGHREKFGDDMFSLSKGATDDSKQLVLKPMNCPCHVQIFKQGLKSYRDLPLRLAEFGSCSRNEPSGTLHGLMRLRGFTQDDAHIFCRDDQLLDEVLSFTRLLQSVYADFGFTDIIYKLSTRPEKRIGDDATWDQSEKALADALDKAGVDWDELPGEGAFYGPKVEFSLRDCLGRIWQCGTIQVDFSMPGRLGASYIDEAGQKQVPVMLHRAVFGSIERFFAILLEETAGWLPVWLAPVQVAVMNVTDEQSDYVNEVAALLREQGVRVHVDLRNEKIGYKIREHTIARVPFQLVCGGREVESRQVAVRERDGKEQKVLALSEFVDYIVCLSAKRGQKA